MKPKNILCGGGETVFSPFSEKKEVFIIKSGYVFAYTYNEEGKRRIHLIYGPGSYFPVITTFNDQPQRATYETLCNTIFVKYDRKQFLEYINYDLAYSNKILKATVAQLENFADRIINLQISRIEDRLLHRLESLASSHGLPKASGRSLPYKLKHHQLADMLGVERESVSRAFAVLKDKGKISINKDGYIKVG